MNPNLDNYLMIGLLTTGTLIILFDLVSIPTGEGLIGAEMIRRALFVY